MDPKKSRLNLPAGMESSLRLDTPQSHFPVIAKTPSPKKVIYSDRFIPCRSSSRLHTFTLNNNSSPAKEGGNDLYLRLLRAELFGTETLPLSPSGEQGSPASPNKNMFRFKMDHSSPSSPLSSVATSHDVVPDSSTPPKPPRKVPKRETIRLSTAGVPPSFLLPSVHSLLFLLPLPWTCPATPKMDLHDLCDDPDYAASQRQDSRINLSLDSDRLSDSSEFEVVYSKENVAIHPSQYVALRITGRLRVIKQSSSLFLTWIPYRDESKLIDSVGQSLSSVATGEDENLYAIKSVPLGDIHSIRRHIPPIGWQYIIVILSSVPPLYFYTGGVREFLATLKQHVYIVRSADDTNVFRLKGLHDSFEKSLSSLELRRDFSVANRATLHHSPSTVSANSDPMRQNGIAVHGSSADSKYRGRKKHKVLDPAHVLSVQVLEKFSLVTKLAREATTQLFREIQDSRLPLGNKKLQSNILPTTIIGHNTRPRADDIEGASVDSKFGRSFVRGKQRKPSLTIVEWRTFLDREGRIMDSKALRKRIFYGGVEIDLRKEVWRFLLGYYDYDSTFAEREYLDSVKKFEYESLKSQWKSISETQARRFTKFRERKGLIEKDVVRTDRSVPYYEGEDNPNVTILRDILLTYSFYNFDLGYCQGMSDLLSPILFVIRDECTAFWSFVALMERLGSNLNRDQNGMHTQLFALMKLLELLDPPLHNYFRKADCLNYFFCFRWILIQFKREFEYEEIMQLWEALWTHHLSEHFHLYISVAILKSHREKIMGEEMDFDTLLKFINGLAGGIDLNAIISTAEILCVSAGEHGAACIPPGTPPSPPVHSDAQPDDQVL